MGPREQERSLLSFLKFVWLNVWFWTIAPLFTLIFATVAAIWVTFFLVVTRNRRRTVRIIRLAVGDWGSVILKCPWPLVRIKYVDHAPHETPPFVFVSNHRSASDGFLMAFLPFECIQVLNIWPSRVPLMGLIAKIAGYLRVREMPFDEFMRAGSKLLAEGVSIIAFPEGTRSGSTKMGKFHGSAFRLAMQNRVKIVPMVLSGNENIPPRGSALLHPGLVVVSKLPAVVPQRYEGMSPYKLKTLVHDMIQDHLDTQAV